MNDFISGAAAPGSSEICGFIQSSVTGSFANATSLSTAVLVPYTWIRAV